MNRATKALSAGQRNASSRLYARPVLHVKSVQEVRRIYIDRGNTLDTGELGILYKGSEITSVPSAYNPNVTSSFIDGIGRGTLEINGVLQSGYVLVVNDTRSGYGNAFLGNNGYVDGPDKPWAFYQVSIPVDGGGAVAAWVCG